MQSDTCETSCAETNKRQELGKSRDILRTFHSEVTDNFACYGKQRSRDEKRNADTVKKLLALFKHRKACHCWETQHAEMTAKEENFWAWMRWKKLLEVEDNDQLELVVLSSARSPNLLRILFKSLRSGWTSRE
jgi:hypothetical protein